MIIVINALSARQGGGQTYLINLLSNLDNIDDRVFVFVSDDMDLVVTENVKLISIGTFGRNPLLRVLWEKFYLTFYLHRVRADILFCPGGVNSTPSSKSYKTVTMFRNMIPFDKKVMSTMSFGLQKLRNFLLRRAMLKTMKNADLTIFISEYARNIINREIQLNKYVVIPHGINLNFRNPSILLDTRLESYKYFLYVSKFDIYKHHQTLIKGYAKALQEIEYRYKLVLIGETSSSEYTKCTELVRDLNIEDSVLFLGPIPYRNLPAYYQNAYINIFASSCENCPNIMLEALASGRPLLSSDVPPMPEFGKDGVVYFSPYDDDSFHYSLDSIMENEGLIESYANKSLELSYKYSWEETAKKTWHTIRDLQNNEGSK